MAKREPEPADVLAPHWREFQVRVQEHGAACTVDELRRLHVAARCLQNTIERMLDCKGYTAPGYPPKHDRRGRLL